MLAVRSLRDTLLNLLFPPRCAGCRQFGTSFCPGCQASLMAYPPDSDPPVADLSALQIAFIFDGPLRSAVHMLKYRGQRRIARPLGELMAAHLAANPLALDALLAVPLHASRLAERGYNQAEELARVVANACGLPLLQGGLVRTRATAQQAQQHNASARRENMSGAFAWQAGKPPRRILVIDDVLTTGATLGACALALRVAGAEAVAGLALARSLRAK